MAEVVVFDAAKAAALFGKLGAVKARQGNYLSVGAYTARIETVKAIETRENGPAIVAEFVIEDAAPVVVPAGKRSVNPGASVAPAHRVGERVSYMMLLSRGEMALRDVKSFIAAADGHAFDDVTAEMVQAAIAPSNPLAGNRVLVRAFNVLTNKGSTFTRVDFTPHGLEAAPEE